MDGKQTPARGPRQSPETISPTGKARAIKMGACKTAGESTPVVGVLATGVAWRPSAGDNTPLIPY